MVSIEVKEFYKAPEEPTLISTGHVVLPKAIGRGWTLGSLRAECVVVRGRGCIPGIPWGTDTALVQHVDHKCYTSQGHQVSQHGTGLTKPAQNNDNF